MQYTGVNELRKKFEDFFVTKDHYPRGSFSLVPEKDKSLLLINSGMAPLKPFFSGAETPPKNRMTTCQKCIRTGDIDNVGKTDRHATFFEMLGNFSFGDYFKREAIQWGWEFITEVLGMPEEKLWATIYEEDDEAHDLWREVVNMPEERIVRLGKEDNFWEIGTGPCGPCSEVYFDQGPAYGCGKKDCKPGCDCDRYLEFWNYVFTQFDRQEDGSYLPLAHPNIDTGMGLERLACIMQDVDSIYAIDTMRTILDEVVRISGVAYHDGEAPSDVSLRVITDHVRTVSFMIADGILPSNEGRGYVLRRLLRRAARHGRLLGLRESFLAELSEQVVQTSATAYPELIQRRDYIKKIISIEEEKFARTIDQGSEILEDYLRQLSDKGSSELSGEQIFKLYDTFGFPLELTREIALEAGCTVDEKGFHAHMEEQREMARAARKADNSEGWTDDAVIFNDFPATVFVGYDTYTASAQVLGLIRGKKRIGQLQEGDEARVILDKTPFYAEGGGQTGDRGMLIADHVRAEVLDTVKVKEIYAHKVRILSGELSEGDRVVADIDRLRRHATARNHTATHLLHKALKLTVGNHVEQAGSYVTPELLRFDFTHFESIPSDTLLEIENIVNREILRFRDVQWETMPVEEAQKRGAVALFGEKYGETVRVITVPEFSMELCGGTHVSNTGQIGSIRILSENGIAAGVRRIEAVTGTGVSLWLRKQQQLIHEIAESLKTNPTGILKKAENMSEEVRRLKKELEQTKLAAATSGVNEMIDRSIDIQGIRLITGKVDNASIGDLRHLSDQIKEQEKGFVLLLAATQEEKAFLLVSVSDDLLERGYHAGNLIKEIAKAAGGSGGGKADMAQAGIKDPARIQEAFQRAKQLLQNR
ncbi:MAG: alanine--tRNA ligase [Eubacteriales bacterium]|nr:alanine--tRNA ligase [Eubacteriales bacterium]